MDSIYTTLNDCRGSDLILTTLKTISDITSTLRNITKDGECRIFYAELRLYCVLIQGQLDRISRSRLYLAGDITDSLIVLLEAAVTKGQVGDGIYPCESRLRTFNAQWSAVRTGDETVRTSFVNSSLEICKDVEQLSHLVSGLAGCEDSIRDRYPEDQELLLTAEDLAPPNRKTSDPSFGVWNAAQSVSKALIACQECACMPSHQYCTRLCLGTYQRPKAQPQELEEDFHFDMFLSFEQSWQETRVHTGTARERVVKFMRTGMEKPASRQRARRQRPLTVERLCEPIGKVLKLPAFRLELEVTDNKLFKRQSERSESLLDLNKSSVTLEEILRVGSRPFTEKTKRILAVFLSYTVFHLHDTPWLHSTWNSSNIVFFRTNTSQIPLRPFLQARLSMEDCDTIFNGAGPDRDEYGSDEDDIDPDDLMPHPCPTIVFLAVLLMEVHFGASFDDLAQRFHVEISHGPSFLAKYLDVDSVFQACKDEIPENYQFLYALEKCLDPTVWEDEEGMKLDSQSLRNTIYQEVVRPLENHLVQGYSAISIEDLDQFARTLDINNWNQTIRSDTSRQQTELEDRSSAPTRRSGSTSPYNSQLHTLHIVASTNRVDDHYVCERPYAATPVLCPTLSCAQQGDYETPRFFDDETALKSEFTTACKQYSSWKREYQNVYNHYITASLDEMPSASIQRVKIAVLDTGIDLNHPYMHECAQNIKAKHDFLQEGGDYSDSDGHGTFVTGLLLDFAPDAEIYIAKVAGKTPLDPRIIAQAIHHAIDIWQVDMISMSFGFPTSGIDGYKDLELALKHAAYRNVLLFAAASNSGGRLGRAYPAREHHVVCVHSTDTHGNPSTFSPTASRQVINLATVGEAVESAWPVHLCPQRDLKDQFKARKSGTSFATPIMVGIASMLMLYARLYLSESAPALKKQQVMENLLRRVAQKGHEEGKRGEYYFVDISLYNDSLFGKPKALINATILDILNS